MKTYDTEKFTELFTVTVKGVSSDVMDGKACIYCEQKYGLYESGKPNRKCRNKSCKDYNENP